MNQPPTLRKLSLPPLGFRSALCCLAAYWVTACTGAALFSRPASAQQESPAVTTAPVPARSRPVQQPVRIFHLKNMAQQNDGNEILIALRDVVFPTDKLWFNGSTFDIVASAEPEQLDLIGHLIQDLDRPKNAYRLTYTLTESDAGRRVGVQHFAMVVVSGQRATLKQGDKVPVATGSIGKDDNTAQTLFTYLDVGINLDATLDNLGTGLRLRSKVEQSSIATTQGTAIAGEPIIRQSVLEGTTLMTPGRPLTLGALDIVGSTRHVDIEVVAEPLP